MLVCLILIPTQSWLLPVGQSLLVDGNLDLVLAVAEVEHVNFGWDAGTSLGGLRGPTWSALSQVEGLTLDLDIPPQHPWSLSPSPNIQEYMRGQNRFMHMRASNIVNIYINIAGNKNVKYICTIICVGHCH